LHVQRGAAPCELATDDWRLTNRAWQESGDPANEGA